MAYQLVQEVLDHTPDGVDAASRLALVIIAELCRGSSRIVDIPRDLFCRRMGVGERGLRSALERLSKAGLEVRVPFGTYKNGRPIYATPGQACRFELPTLKPSPEDPETSMEEGGTVVPPPNEGGTRTSEQGTRTSNQGTRTSNQGTTVPPYQTGETFGLSPVHGENPARSPFAGPAMNASDARALIREKTSQSSKRTRPIKPVNGTRPAFEALMTYQVDNQEPEHGPPPGL